MVSRNVYAHAVCTCCFVRLVALYSVPMAHQLLGVGLQACASFELLSFAESHELVYDYAHE